MQLALKLGGRRVGERDPYVKASGPWFSAREQLLRRVFEGFSSLSPPQQAEILDPQCVARKSRKSDNGRFFAWYARRSTINHEDAACRHLCVRTDKTPGTGFTWPRIRLILHGNWAPHRTSLPSSSLPMDRLSVITSGDLNFTTPTTLCHR